MSDNTKVQVRREGEIGVVDVEGYINSDGGEEVAAACNGLLDDGVLRCVLNLEKCTIVNSVGISFLIEVIERVKELQGRIAFCSVTRTIGKTFQIMGLLQTAELHDGEAEALAALQG